VGKFVVALSWIVVLLFASYVPVDAEASAAQKLYFPSFVTATIHRADLDGSNPEPLGLQANTQAGIGVEPLRGKLCSPSSISLRPRTSRVPR
jgi:hypothetical protein